MEGNSFLRSGKLVFRAIVKLCLDGELLIFADQELEIVLVVEVKEIDSFFLDLFPGEQSNSLMIQPEGVDPQNFTAEIVG